MHRSVKSINGTQDDELANIDAQLDFANRVLKWSILDLEKFIHSLKQRVQAEEVYVTALIKITRYNNTNGVENTPPTSSTLEQNYFGDYTTSYSQTTSRYESSIEKTIEARQGFISCLKSQIDNLLKVKDSHEQRRKKVKAVLGEKNMNYISYRTKDIVKFHRSYFNKCGEYVSLQNQILISSHEDNPNNNHNNNNNLDPHHFSPTMARISSEESRKSSDSGRGDIDSHSIASQENSTSPPHNKKNSMAGFITQMRSQLANAAAAGDPSKQTARLAKLKKEIHDSDQEYRQGIRILEFLRKKQAETAVHAIRHVEAILLDKSDAVKAVMIAISKQEEETLSTQSELMKQSLESIYSMDGKKDTDQFLIEYEKLGFIKPKPIYYVNFTYGVCKEILFGSNLNEYCQEHNRTVPLIVTKCIKQVEVLGGLEKEGIYRISGRQTNVDQLKSEFEKNDEVLELDSKFDVFTIASVLKIYLRELKQPLFNLTMQERIEHSKIADDSQRKNKLLAKLTTLSIPQRDTLKAVITHLAKVESYSNINKMTIKNLSVIFTPAIFHDHNQAENAGEWYSDKVLEDLIFHHETLFAIAENQSRILMEQRQQQQQQQLDSPSASVLSLPFTSRAVLTRHASLSTTKLNHSTPLKEPTTAATPTKLNQAITKELPITKEVDTKPIVTKELPITKEATAQPMAKEIPTTQPITKEPIKVDNTTTT